MTELTDLETPEVSELALLKDRANKMGISFSNNIGVDALRKKIQEVQENSESTPAPVISKAAKLRQEAIREGMKLVRVRIQNLDPKKASLPGEILTVANEYLGTVRKYIPYTSDFNAVGYHVPQCLLNMMKERTFLHITQKKINGIMQVQANDVPEFNIVVLPPLTQHEIHQLAEAQLAAGTATVGAVGR